MPKKYIKRIIVNFLLCFVGSIICAILWGRLFTKEHEDGISLFFYILIMGFPVILPLAFIYLLYFFSSFYIVKNIKLRIIKIFFLLLYGILYSFMVLKISWLNSQSRYHSFDEYIKEGDVYLVFSIIAVIQIGIFLSIRKLDIKEM